MDYGEREMDYKDKIKNYIDLEIRVLNNLDFDEINNVMNILENARLHKKNIFIFGNGGSAATSSHFVCDFNKGIYCANGHKYNFECLNDNVPLMMAIANDIGYEDIFVVPLQNKMREGDIVIGISGSGNSQNVIKALEYANKNHGITISLTGYDGGMAKKISKYSIHVNVENMQIVEDIHMILDHLMMFVLNSTIQ